MIEKLVPDVVMDRTRETQPAERRGGLLHFYFLDGTELKIETKE